MLRTFLRNVSRNWQITIFTAGLKEYADRILDDIPDVERYVSRRLYRDSCTMLDGVPLKDLRKITTDL
jgi:TFIIF-interacting CTD phosphatase-like protein